MICFRRLCFSDYRWLWILTIIIVIIVVSITRTEAKQNSVNDSFDTTIANNNNNNESNDLTINKFKSIDENTTQRTVLRPSSVLKKFWSSASNLLNNDNADNHMNNSSHYNDIHLKDFLFRPIKWSSDIVPSLPIGVQLSNYLSPHLINRTKYSTKGDITVINGLYSQSVSYPPRDYRIADRSDHKYELNSNGYSVITPSNLVKDMNSDEIMSTLESITSKVSVPMSDIKADTTTSPVMKSTIPTRIITTTATITSPTLTSGGRRSSRTKDTISLTSKPLAITKPNTRAPIAQPLVIKTKYKDSAEARRQAIRERFGQIKREFGSRISRTPPKVSIDSFLSVYKPALKSQIWEKALKARRNESIVNSETKSAKNISENSLPEIKSKVANKTADNYANNTKERQNAEQVDPLVTVESRNILSTYLLFPSRPTPLLRPKLTNSSDDYQSNKLTEKLNNSSKNSLQNKSNIGNENVKNVSNNVMFAVLERRDDNQLMTSVPKNEEFGYRKKINANFADKKHSNNESSIEHIIEKKNTLTQIKAESDLIDGQSYEEPMFNSEGMPIYLTEARYQDIPMDLLKDTHRHYVNKMKLEEHNDKYRNLPNPQLFKDELNKPEEGEEPTFGIRPVDPDYYKKSSSHKVKATLPNKLMKFEEMVRHLAQVMRSINRLNPIGKSLSNKYKEFASKVKHDIMSKNKGTYARSYPPGYYDDDFDRVPVEESVRRSDDDMSESEINESYVDSPNNYTYIDGVGDINTGNNDSYTHNDYDDEGLIKKSFGYKVTVYRSPEGGESNITEEVLDNDFTDNNMNKSDDLTVSESSDEYLVTTDMTNNGSEPLMTSESNLLRGESQSGLKGNEKGMDYKRTKYNRERGSHAKESVNANKIKKVDTHDRRANNERALKEKTVIEFFEREHILDSAYNKDKLGIDKNKANEDKASDDQHTSGSMTSGVSETDGKLVKTGTINGDDSHEYSNSDKSHVTNGQTFDTVFPEHDRKYKHKDNAHKYKGWKERGYKIITETEFVDRGRKVDTGFKKDVNGSSEHIKEKSAGDVTKGDLRKYRKNVKNVNKNYETLYGSAHKSPKTYEVNTEAVVNGDDSDKYYYNGINSGVNSGESQYQQKDHKLYDNVPTEQTVPEKTVSETHINESTGAADGFHAPPIDTEHWRPITKTADHLDYYPKPKHNYNENNNNHNIYVNDMTDENYGQNIVKAVNDNIDKNVFPTIISDTYGGPFANPYSMPLVSEDVGYSSGANHNKDELALIPHFYKDQEYYYEPIPKPNPILSENHNSNDFFNDNHNNEYEKQTNHSSNSHKNNNHNNDNRYYRNYYPNNTYLKATNADYQFTEPQATPHYPSVMDNESEPKVPAPTDDPYNGFTYQVYPPDNDNHINPNNYYNKQKERPLDFGVNTYAIIDSHTQLGQTSNLNPNIGSTGSRYVKDVLLMDSKPNVQNTDYRKKKANKAPVPLIDDRPAYVKPTKINARIPRVKKYKPYNKYSGIKKRPKNYRLVAARPLLPPIIDGLYLDSGQIQTIVNPMSQYNGYKIRPYKVSSAIRNSPLRGSSHIPVHYYAPHYSGSHNQPVALVHPKQVITISGSPGHKYGSNLWSNLNSDGLINPFRWIYADRKQSVPQNPKSKLNLISPNISNTKLKFRNKFLFRNWFKSTKA